MDWPVVIGSLIALFTSGGVVYLIVERLLDRKKTNAEVEHQQVENKKETVEYGITMVSIYNEIDKIVESKTKPIQDKLDHALTRIDDLESNWCCFREDCPYRARTRKDLTIIKALDDVAKEAIRRRCKD